MSFVSKRKARAVIAIAMVHHCLQKRKKKKKKRSYWSKDWLQSRDTASHSALLPELRENNPDDFRNYLRMSDAGFISLLRAVTPLIQKQDTCMRKSISAEQRLVATLRFLATGRSFEDLKFSTAISPQALGVLIPETCNAIVQVLKGEYLKFPTTPEEWKVVAKEFDDFWNFPNCGGAIGGRHVRINPPPHSGSFYYNHKGFFSIVLVAIVNAEYEFLMIDVGKNGRMSDGGVIEQTHFYHKLKEKMLYLPPTSDTKDGLNFVFVADESFCLHEHLLTPFPEKALTEEKKIFNYRLSRASRVVENAFGLLSSRFRIFHTTINLSPYKIELVAMACCLLHNFLRRSNSAEYCPGSMLERENMDDGSVIPGEWSCGPPGLVPLQLVQPQKLPCDAKISRDKYMEFFSGSGAVAWQDAMV
ncbi:uncharacterized protein LOC134908815 [Pseudophryne corroboree]|uniref:uncharacterized protein LOC134908815 n=1 Tax=Pseudophryne corroboree TaxID=495146 RepID=UPI0030813A2A